MIAFAHYRSTDNGFFRYIWWLFKTFLLLAGSIFSTCASSAEVAENIQIHGFASQGLISSTHNNFFGPSGNSVSTEYTELGVNFSYRPHPDLQFSAQAMSRRAGETDNGSIRLDYGFIGYNLISTESTKAGFLLGKIKNPLGFYNETRDIAFTRPSIVLPQSIYFDRTRNFALSATGAQFYAEHTNDSGLLSFRASVGNPKLGDKSSEYAVLGGDRPGDISGKTSYLGRLMYEWDGDRLRLAVTHGKVNSQYNPGASDPFASGTFSFSPWMLSFQYNTEKWSFTSEYALRESKFSGFGPVLSDREIHGESAYVQGVYRFAPSWEGLIRYDALYQDKHDRSGEKNALLSKRPAYFYYAKDWTIGLRHDVTPSFMLSGEFHTIDGTGWLPFEDNLGSVSPVRRWNLFLFQGAYRF